MSELIPPEEFNSGAGGEIDECALLLRFFGDELDPHTITALLGVEPTEARRKGEGVHKRTGGLKGVSTGYWLLDCERTPDTLENQIKLLLSDLTDDLHVWRQLTGSFAGELKCHLFLRRWTRGTILPSETLTELAERGLALHLEVYTPMLRSTTE